MSEYDSITVIVGSALINWFEMCGYSVYFFANTHFI